MTINTTFTTGANDTEIMTVANIQNRLANALGLTSAEYTQRLSETGVRMSFVLFLDGANTVTINNSNYSNSLIEDAVYASGDQDYIKSIKIGSACTGTISITLG